MIVLMASSKSAMTRNSALNLILRCRGNRKSEA
nr:MAG TPA: hypothetical protein [Caudoviricetes sp.]